MIQPKRGGKQGFQADGAVLGLGPGVALGLHVLRVVVGANDVDGAVGDRRDHRLPVVLVAQGRRHLEEGAVGADVVLVVGQVIDRDAGGDVEAALLAGADDVRAVGGRDEVGVVLRLRHGDEAQVPLQHDDFRFARHAG